ncbi:MAG: hypothetical protein DRZ76_01385 [Candidatus Nealsonbacteria bacterium]|nr:MAG: hypothetical protein DRZ76_01385 [Candidatus Nealsonbacteria bacterium]
MAIDTISPSEINTRENILLTITGADIGNATKVKINDLNCGNITVVDENTIKVYSKYLRAGDPTSSLYLKPGYAKVEVFTSTGNKYTSTSDLKVISSPSIKDVKFRLNNEYMYVYGSDFMGEGETNTPEVTINDQTSEYVYVINKNTLHVSLKSIISFLSGPTKITITNTDGGTTEYKSNQKYMGKPIITYVSPISLSRDSTTEVTVVGTNIDDNAKIRVSCTSKNSSISSSPTVGFIWGTNTTVVGETNSYAGNGIKKIIKANISGCKNGEGSARLVVVNPDPEGKLPIEQSPFVSNTIKIDTPRYNDMEIPYWATRPKIKQIVATSGWDNNYLTYPWNNIVQHEANDEPWKRRSMGSSPITEGFSQPAAGFGGNTINIYGTGFCCRDGNIDVFFGKNLGTSSGYALKAPKVVMPYPPGITGAMDELEVVLPYGLAGVCDVMVKNSDGTYSEVFGSGVVCPVQQEGVHVKSSTFAAKNGGSYNVLSLINTPYITPYGEVPLPFIGVEQDITGIVQPNVVYDLGVSIRTNITDSNSYHGTIGVDFLINDKYHTTSYRQCSVMQSGAIEIPGAHTNYVINSSDSDLNRQIVRVGEIVPYPSGIGLSRSYDFTRYSARVCIHTTDIESIKIRVFAKNTDANTKVDFTNLTLTVAQDDNLDFVSSNSEISTPNYLFGPQGVEYHDGFFWVASPDRQRVLKINRNTGQLSDEFGKYRDGNSEQIILRSAASIVKASNSITTRQERQEKDVFIFYPQTDPNKRLYTYRPELSPFDFGYRPGGPDNNTNEADKYPFGENKYFNKATEINTFLAGNNFSEFYINTRFRDNTYDHFTGEINLSASRMENVPGFLSHPNDTSLPLIVHEQDGSLYTISDADGNTYLARGPVAGAPAWTFDGKCVVMEVNDYTWTWWDSDVIEKIVETDEVDLGAIAPVSKWWMFDARGHRVPPRDSLTYPITEPIGGRGSWKVGPNSIAPDYSGETDWAGNSNNPGGLILSNYNITDLTFINNDMWVCGESACIFTKNNPENSRISMVDKDGKWLNVTYLAPTAWASTFSSYNNTGIIGVSDINGFYSLLGGAGIYGVAAAPGILTMLAFLDYPVDQPGKASFRFGISPPVYHSNTVSLVESAMPKYDGDFLGGTVAAIGHSDKDPDNEILVTCSDSPGVKKVKILDLPYYHIWTVPDIDKYTLSTIFGDGTRQYVSIDNFMSPYIDEEKDFFYEIPTFSGLGYQTNPFTLYCRAYRYGSNKPALKFSTKLNGGIAAFDQYSELNNPNGLNINASPKKPGTESYIYSDGDPSIKLPKGQPIKQPICKEQQDVRIDSNCSPPEWDDRLPPDQQSVECGPGCKVTVENFWFGEGAEDYYTIYKCEQQVSANIFENIVPSGFTFRDLYGKYYPIQIGGLKDGDYASFTSTNSGMDYDLENGYMDDYADHRGSGMETAPTATIYSSYTYPVVDRSLIGGNGDYSTDFKYEDCINWGTIEDDEGLLNKNTISFVLGGEASTPNITATSESGFMIIAKENQPTQQWYKKEVVGSTYVSVSKNIRYFSECYDDYTRWGSASIKIGETDKEFFTALCGENYNRKDGINYNYKNTITPAHNDFKKENYCRVGKRYLNVNKIGSLGCEIWRGYKTFNNKWLRLETYPTLPVPVSAKLAIYVKKNTKRSTLDTFKIDVWSRNIPNSQEEWDKRNICYGQNEQYVAASGGHTWGIAKGYSDIFEKCYNADGTIASGLYSFGVYQGTIEICNANKWHFLELKNPENINPSGLTEFEFVANNESSIPLGERFDYFDLGDWDSDKPAILKITYDTDLI